MTFHTNAEPLLRITDLEKHFPVRLGAYGERKATIKAVDGLNFDIHQGETLALVGESGCGKSTVGFTLLQLFHPTGGSVIYQSQDLTKLSEKHLRPVRQKLQIIFQDPYSTLNPRMPIGVALSEPLQVHNLLAPGKVKERVVALLESVGMSADCMGRYPHEFSGGQRQRICIARALVCQPEFIVCDEPTSALDVSIQAQIINLLQDLQASNNLTYLFISHDMGLVRHISDRIAVMYLGRFAELASKETLFEKCLHPYTEVLLSAVPIPDPERERNRKRRILQGDVPNAIDPPDGCRFHPRCPIASQICTNQPPAWRQVAHDHWVACHAVP
jgi:peptide/nickel transport system ATP-binding protein